MLWLVYVCNRLDTALRKICNSYAILCCTRPEAGGLSPRKQRWWTVTKWRAILYLFNENQLGRLLRREQSKYIIACPYYSALQCTKSGDPVQRPRGCRSFYFLVFRGQSCGARAHLCASRSSHNQKKYTQHHIFLIATCIERGES